MSKLAALAVSAALGCSGRGGDASTGQPPPCPSEPKLRATLAAAWKVDPGTIASPVCASGRFGGPGWIVNADILDAPGSTMAFSRWSVLDPAGTAIWTDDEQPIPRKELDAERIGDMKSIDLDGDGTDELVFTITTKPPTHGVVVYAVKPKDLRLLLALGHDLMSPPDADGQEGKPLCDGDYSFEIAAPRTLAIHEKLTGPSEYQECVAGTELYTLDHHRMTKHRVPDPDRTGSASSH